MDCRLCGLPTPVPPIKGDGHGFCCIGCREVYRHFGSDSLAGEDEQPPITSISPQSVAEGKQLFVKIDGMHCSSCEVLVARLASRIEGVLSLTSSYATSSAKVTYDPAIIDQSQLLSALSVAGYTARLRSGGPSVRDDDARQLLRVLAASSLSAVVMMLYLAFFYPTNLGLVEPGDLEPMGWLAFKAVPNALFVLTTVLVIYAGAPIFRGAIIGLRARMLNMDNLLSIAILASYFYSVAQWWAGSLDLYFDVTAAIIAVVTFGRYFERGARIEATAKLSDLLQAWTPRAHIQRKRLPACGY